MPKLNDTGVYQLPNGYWAFRYVVVVNEKRIEQQYPMPDIGQYRYGVDFLYNPLFYLEIQQQIVKQSKDSI